MGRISQNIKIRINLIEHLEKSKCFFRAQKGGAYVHLGMGADCFRVVGIFVVNLYYSGRVQRNN